MTDAERKRIEERIARRAERVGRASGINVYREGEHVLVGADLSGTSKARTVSREKMLVFFEKPPASTAG